MNRLSHTIKYLRKTGGMAEPPRFVYFIECQGYVKVGVAYDPAKRIVDLQVGSPFKHKLLKTFECINAQKYEAKLHKLWRQFRVQGEWFRVPSDLLKLVIELSDLTELLDD